MYYATGQPGWMRFGGQAGPYSSPAAYQNPDPEMEKQVLKNQADTLESELEFVKKRLSEMEGRPSAE